MDPVDVIALVVAAGSLGVSIWAVFVAKTEPTRARARAHRDVVRATFNSALQAMSELSSSLAAGKPVPPLAPEVPAAREVVNVYWRRVPESRTLHAMIPKLYSLQSTWEMSAWNEKRVQDLNEDLEAAELRAEKSPDLAVVIRQTAREHRSRLDEYTRQREGSISELGKAVDNAQGAMRSYVNDLDDKDRTGKS